MARIKTYSLDGTINPADKLIGSDGEPGSNFGKTKNYSVSTLGDGLISLKSIITGTGTLNTIPLWTPDGTKLGNSIITQNISGVSEITIGGRLSVTGDLIVDGRADFTGLYARFRGQIQDSNDSGGTAGQVLSSTGTGVEWVDSSAAITKLIPYFQLATPGGSATYTQPNNIVDFDWSGGSGTYEYILPSATAIPYRTIRFVNNSTITASDKIHITAPGTETIDGGAFYSINKPYNGCAVWSDGVQWIVIQAKA